MKDSLKRLAAWAKKHPVIAGLILLAVVVVAFIAYKRNQSDQGDSSIAVPEGAGESLIPISGAGGGAGMEIPGIPDITLPEIPSFPTGGGGGGGGGGNGGAGGYNPTPGTTTTTTVSYEEVPPVGEPTSYGFLEPYEPMSIESDNLSSLGVVPGGGTGSQESGGLLGALFGALGGAGEVVSNTVAGAGQALAGAGVSAAAVSGGGAGDLLSSLFGSAAEVVSGVTAGAGAAAQQIVNPVSVATPSTSDNITALGLSTGSAASVAKTATPAKKNKKKEPKKNKITVGKPGTVTNYNKAPLSSSGYYTGYTQSKPKTTSAPLSSSGYFDSGRM